MHVRQLYCLGAADRQLYCLGAADRQLYCLGAAETAEPIWPQLLPSEHVMALGYFTEDRGRFYRHTLTIREKQRRRLINPILGYL